MNLNAHRGHLALALAAAAAASIGCHARTALATTYSTSTSTDTSIELGGYYNSNASSFEIESPSTGKAKYENFEVFDFSAASLGLPSGSAVTAINSATFSLTDLDYSFTAAGTFNVYLSNNNNALAGLTYQPTDVPQGIGSQLSTLYPVATIAYAPGKGGTTTSGGSTANTTIPTALTLTGDSLSYLLDQLNSAGNIRIVVTTATDGMTGDFAGSGTGAYAPSLALDLTTQSLSGASNFTINGGTKTQTITFDRIVNSATVTTPVTLTNSGTGAGIYSFVNSTSAVATAGANPLSANASTQLSVGMHASTVEPGSVSAANPATATVTVHDQTNSGDGDATLTIQANQVVANRIINNAGGTGGVINFGSVLEGTTSAPVTVTLDTENTTGVDKTSASLTTVELPAATTVSSLLSSGPSAAADSATLAAGASDVLFNDGSVTTTRTVTFTGGAAAGGLYASHGYYEGYLTVPLVNQDTALGADTNPTGRIYVEADVYQQASVSGKLTGTQYNLTNLAHTYNSPSASVGDIGIRASAQVTSATILAQAGWTQDPGLVPGASISDGASMVGASFDPTAKWNGTYTGTLSVGLQNDQSITGATPNDLGTQKFALSTSVAGNSGNASVNILPGGSFAGYSIPSGLGKNSTVSLLGGASASGNTIGVTWSGGSSAFALSDQATLTRTASDLMVVQMSYDPTAITQSAAGSPELAYVNSKGATVLATLGNSDNGASAAETIGSFSGTPTLGEYGIDPVAHTVWAVVDHVGTFESLSRELGDANGDATVDVNDLNTVLSHLGVATTLWSNGNFDGAATIDLNDLNDVLNNLGASLPTLAHSGTLDGSPVASPNLPTPEPATLSIAALGAVGMFLRRRKPAAC